MGFPVGSLVQAFGLTGASHLNGKQGVVNGRTQVGRIGVDFPSPDGTKALQAKNLVLVEDSKERAAMVCTPCKSNGPQRSMGLQQATFALG